MPVEVTRDTELPLIIAKLWGQVTAEDIVELYRLSNQLMTSEDDLIYRITWIAEESETTFPEMFKAIQKATLALPASTLDSRIHPIFLGTSSWITFARNAFLQHGRHVPAFDTMEAVMAYIHYDLEESAETSSH
ncbi:hypothetical protein G4Y79_24300 [Phototrophicus methaneseepsis]|uniref:Uncharacterized protein n=1 Tax=Phototrophicus methaneseepsis TaxID=2710758 RepID=A0A7S8IFB5_9CHLR|nr:hypothetical protein [Phototrophicus methaneseepsis]QPC82768.1 hypothetical protein G4Y79_24300 [Phototrophicus methaneseepsis]